MIAELCENWTNATATIQKHTHYINTFAGVSDLPIRIYEICYIKKS